ncbi:uncharacterized protein LOC128549007 [Mercenaria mercenaria]|uniref:uncharacterized protein LOC128549007 n=1 Tax=Mercenaria mercenaria TaxID=6596 RepID=UPI00234EF4B6|nr:uncharacterized protein LOC128549007 [Mercenaria mercenaria]
MSSYANFINLILLVSLSAGADNVFDGKQSDILDGNAVMDVGHALRNPLVKFIGAVVKSLEDNMNAKLTSVLSHLPSCLDWSVWTECIHIKANFGIQNRTRMCGTMQDTSIESKNITEYVTRLCEMHKSPEDQPISSCPEGYTRTEHGFCVTLKTDYVSWDTAQSNCESDGGNLINIDSQTKSQDIAKTFKDRSLSSYVLIDGVQESSGADWEARSGAKNSFFNWKTGEPKKLTSFPHCRYAKKEHATKEWVWYAHYPCSSTGQYICEIAL